LGLRWWCRGRGDALGLRSAVTFWCAAAAARWGSFEWSGDWSDDSSKWAEHPKCAKACGHEGAQADGIFWMEFTDFRRHYRCG
jgi:hypothetical protein